MKERRRERGKAQTNRRASRVVVVLVVVVTIDTKHPNQMREVLAPLMAKFGR